MKQNLLPVNILGTSFTIRTDESAEYIEQITWFLEKKIMEVRKQFPVTDPLKISILASVYLVDELFKERIGQGNSSLSNLEAEELGRITHSLIEAIDQVLD